MSKALPLVLMAAAALALAVLVGLGFLKATMPPPTVPARVLFVAKPETQADIAASIVQAYHATAIRRLGRK